MVRLRQRLKILLRVTGVQRNRRARDRIKQRERDRGTQTSERYSEQGKERDTERKIARIHFHKIFYGFYVYHNNNKNSSREKNPSAEHAREIEHTETMK